MTTTREGQEMYTPRLLVVDHKENMGTYHPDSSAFHGKLGGGLGSNADSEYIPWTGPVSHIKARPAKKNSFLQMLDEEQAMR